MSGAPQEIIPNLYYVIWEEYVILGPFLSLSLAELAIEVKLARGIDDGSHHFINLDRGDFIIYTIPLTVWGKP